MQSSRKGFGRKVKPVGCLHDKTSVRREEFFQRQRTFRACFLQKLRHRALEALALPTFSLSASLRSEEEEDKVGETQHAAPKRASDASSARQGPAEELSLEQHKEPASFPECQTGCSTAPPGPSTGRSGRRITQSGNRKPAQVARRAAAQYLAQQLVIPDFFVDVPPNLAVEWLAYCLPEGPRVFLVAGGGRCCVFSKSGIFLEAFPAPQLPYLGCTILTGVLVTPPASRPNHLPQKGSATKDLSASSQDCNSCPWTMEKEDVPTVTEDGEGPVPYRRLDLGQRGNAGTTSDGRWIAIYDALVWGECSLGELPAECRLFMLQSKFEEIEDSPRARAPQNGLPLRYIRAVEATVDNLRKLYSTRSAASFITNLGVRTLDSTVALPVCGSLDYIPDSIMFVHREALYLPGLSPLYLCWRDFRLSRFPIDTTDGKTIEPRQVVTLRLRFHDGALLTEDRIVVYRIAPDTIQSLLEPFGETTVYLRLWRKGHLKETLLIRGTVDGLNLGVPLPKREADVLQALEDRFESERRDPISVHDADSTVLGGESNGTLDEKEAQNLLQNFVITGTPSPKRCKADTINRIIHQFLLRKQWEEEAGCSLPQLGSSGRSRWLSFCDILECAATGAPNYSMMLLGGKTHLEKLMDDDEAAADAAESDQGKEGKYLNDGASKLEPSESHVTGATVPKNQPIQDAIALSSHCPDVQNGRHSIEPCRTLTTGAIKLQDVELPMNMDTWEGW